MAHKIKKTLFVSWGTLVGLIGLILLFVFPVGTIIGIVLLILSARIGSYWMCSDCGKRIEKTSNMCPTCRADLVGEKKRGISISEAITLFIVVIIVPIIIATLLSN